MVSTRTGRTCRFNVLQHFKSICKIMINWIKNQIHFNQKRDDKWVEEMAASVPQRSIILDVGAGGSPYRKFFMHCEYKTQDFCQLADHQIVQGGYAKIDYVCDITDLPLPDSSFDVVLNTEVLEHVPHPVKALSEMARVLKSGGRLFLTAPLGSGLHQEPFHFYGGYTPFFYRKFLSELGFQDIKVEAKGGSFSHFAQWLTWYFNAANPFRHGMALPKKLGLFLPYLLQLPMVMVLYMYSRFIDQYDADRQFTGGYLVSATKQ